MKKQWMVCAAAIVLATALVGCGDSGNEGDGNDRQDAGTGLADVGDTDGTQSDVGGDDVGQQDSGGGDDVNDSGNTVDADPSTIDLSGVWAQQTTMSSLSKVPVVGNVTTRTITVQKVEIGGESPNYTVVSTPCTVEMESSSALVSTIVPDAFVRGLSATERTLEVDGNRFEMPSFWEARGVRLTDVVADALPTDKNDSRIFDQDGDGKPGMTVRISGIVNGDIYVIQRGSTALSGALDNQQLDGLIVWTDEQVILGSDNSILASNQPENTIDPKAENSFFRTTRLAGDLSCEAIVSQADALFAR